MTAQRNLRWRPGRSPLLVLAGAAILSCSDDPTGPETADCAAETSSVEATVSVGSSVTFDWSPRCAVAFVLVEEDGGDVWWISTSEDDWDSPNLANRITPPVTYGQVPAGILDSYGPDPLVPGTTYELVLWRILPAGSTAQCQARIGSACLIAVKEFTR